MSSPLTRAFASASGAWNAGSAARQGKRREKTPAHCAASILDAAHALVVWEIATSVDVS